MSDEEQNLSRRERRAQAKNGGSDDGGVEDVKDRNQKLRSDAAARRRKARQVERNAAAAEGLDAGERMDDAMMRGSAAAGRFLRSNFVWLQWVVIAGIAGAMGYLIFNYRKSADAEKRGTTVASVLAAQFGRIVVSEPVQQPDPRLVDPRREFASEEERAAAATQSWKGLEGLSTEMRIFAQIGEAGALYDSQKFAEARAAYEKVLNASQVGLHPGIKGRALEGIALSLEAEEKYPEALKAYEALKGEKSPEFEKLARFHIARVEFLSGNKQKATELLTALDKELSKDAGPEGPVDYLGAAVRDLLKTVDPSRAKKEREELSADQMQRLMKQFEEMQKQRGENGMPALPPIPSAPPAAPLPAPKTEEVPSEAPAPVAPVPTPKKVPVPVPSPAVPSSPPVKAPTPVPPVKTPTPVPPVKAPTAPAPAPTAPAPAPTPPVQP